MLTAYPFCYGYKLDGEDVRSPTVLASVPSRHRMG